MASELAIQSAPTATTRIATSERVLAGLAAAACLSVLVLAAWLDPDPSGMGTHLQLGLTPCGFLTTFGRPCPTCGMTTAFALAADGRLAASFQAQPFGFLLAVGFAAGAWCGGFVAATGSRIRPLISVFLTTRCMWILAGLAILAWISKIVTYVPS